MPNPVFISYSSREAKIANQLVSYLESNGIPCWIAPRDIASGHDYTDSIDQAIKRCSGFVLIFSAHSAKSVWVKKELTLGVSHNKNIIPFKISDTELDGGLNFMLNNLQWIVATDHPADHFPEVVQGLRRYDNSIPSVDPLPPHHKRTKHLIAASGIAAALLAALLILHPWTPNSPALPLADTLPTPAPADTAAVQTAQPVAPQPKTDNTKPEKKTAADKNTKKTSAATSQATGSTPTSKAAPASPTTSKAAPAPQAENASAVDKASDPAPAPAPAKPAAPAKSAASTKYNKAVTLYNLHRYKEALALFEELKAQGCQEKDLDLRIKKCQELTK